MPLGLVQQLGALVFLDPFLQNNLFPAPKGAKNLLVPIMRLNGIAHRVQFCNTLHMVVVQRVHQRRTVALFGVGNGNERFDHFQIAVLGGGLQGAALTIFWFGLFLLLAFAFFCLAAVFGPALSFFNIIVQWHQILVSIFDPLLDLCDLFQPRVVFLLAFAHYALPFLGKCTANGGVRQMAMFCGTLIQTHWSDDDVFTFPLSLQ